MLSLSMTILAKSSDLDQMKSLDADAYHLTLRISLFDVRAKLIMAPTQNVSPLWVFQATTLGRSLQLSGVFVRRSRPPQRLVLFRATYPHFTGKGAPLTSPTYL